MKRIQTASFVDLLEINNKKNDQKSLDNVIKHLQNDFSLGDFTKENILRKEYVFSNLTEDFLNFYALNLIERFEISPQEYFIKTNFILNAFPKEKLIYLLEKAIDLSVDSISNDYFIGLTYLEQMRFEEALIYFTKVDHWIGHYFSGLSYFSNESFENSIIQFNLFLEDYNDLCEDGFSDNGQWYKFYDFFPSLRFFKSNVLDFLAYSYVRTSEYGKALSVYDEIFEELDIQMKYDILNGDKVKNEMYDSFQEFIGDYIFALEKTFQYEKAIEVLEFVIYKYPKERLYRNVKQSMEQKRSNKGVKGKLIKIQNKIKRPFGIDNYTKVKMISKERILEDMIIEQIKYGYQVFGKNLEVYKSEFIFGKQYFLPSVNGFLDLLLIDKKENQLYVVELKRDGVGIEVLDQIKKYIKGIKIDMNKVAKGIICIHRSDSELVDLVKEEDNIELFTYGFDFEKLG